MTLYHLPSAQVVQQGQLRTIINHKPYYAKDDDGWSTSLDAEQLASCHQLGQLRLCDHLREVRRGIYDCTSAIFEAAPLDNWCETQQTPIQEGYVIAVDSNLFYGRSPSVKEVCPGRKDNTRFHDIPINL